MNADQYLLGVLASHRSASSLIVAQNMITTLTPSINVYANGFLEGIYIAGSIAKGTAISATSDVDILISVKSDATETLKDIYEILFNRLTMDGYAPRRQNVSLGITHGGWKVDVVPAKKHNVQSNDHSLWSHKSQTWRETNIHGHVKYVTDSMRTNEIKLLKIWKKLHGLEFPSFPLEVTVITALNGSSYTALGDNFVKVLKYLRDSLPTARLIDPTKPSNILSDELTAAEKAALSMAATNSLGGKWEQVLW